MVEILVFHKVEKISNIKSEKYFKSYDRILYRKQILDITLITGRHQNPSCKNN